MGPASPNQWTSRHTLTAVYLLMAFEAKEIYPSDQLSVTNLDTITKTSKNQLSQSHEAAIEDTYQAFVNELRRQQGTVK